MRAIPYLAAILLVVLGVAGLLAGGPQSATNEPATPNQEPLSTQALGLLLSEERAPNASPHSVPAAIQRHVDDVLRAPTALHVCLAYDGLFKAARRDDLQALQSGPHDGIAIRVAWEHVVRRTFEARQAPRRENRGIKLDRRALSQFIGFVEGRLRVTAPQWWKDAIVRGRVFDRESFKFPVERNFRYHETLPGLYAPADLAVESHRGYSILHLGKESLKVEGDVLRGDPEDPASVSALVSPERWYVAPHGSTGGEFRLLCFGRDTGKVLWDPTVWANDTVLVRSGVFREGERPGSHVVTIIEHGERVFVFGAEGTAMYVEGFSANDGTNLFRFCTSY